MTVKRTGRPRPSGQGRRRNVRRRQKAGWSLYKRIVVAILIFGGLFLGSKIYELWQIQQDMTITVNQERELTEENHRQFFIPRGFAHEEKDRLSSPEEIMRQAREQFGLAKPGEIPYRR